MAKVNVLPVPPVPTLFVGDAFVGAAPGRAGAVVETQAVETTVREWEGIVCADAEYS